MRYMLYFHWIFYGEQQTLLQSRLLKPPNEQTMWEILRKLLERDGSSFWETTPFRNYAEWELHSSWMSPWLQGLDPLREVKTFFERLRSCVLPLKSLFKASCAMHDAHFNALNFCWSEYPVHFFSYPVHFCGATVLRSARFLPLGSGKQPEKCCQNP